MKEKKLIAKHVMVLFAIIMMALGIPSITKADATDYQTTITTDRAAGQVKYSISGIDPEQTKTLTLQVTDPATKAAVLEQPVSLTTENCMEGTYTGTFSLSDLNYAYGSYTVSVVIDENTIPLGNTDLSIHKDKISLTVQGTKSAASRTMTLVSKEAAGEVLVPGEGNQVSIMAWPKSASETTAKLVGAKTNLNKNNGLVWTANISKAGTAYGTWYARLVLTNTKNTSVNIKLAEASYSITPTISSFVVSKTKSLEKKKSFSLYIYSLKNVYGVRSLSFRVYNSKGKKVATIAGKRKNTSGSQFSASVTMKKLKYKLDKYTIKAVLTDNNGKTKTISKSVSADQRAKSGTLSVTKKQKKASCVYKLSNAYLPGNIKKVNFVLYKVKGKSKKKQGTYTVKSTAGKKKITTTVNNNKTGSYLVRAYGYTAWNKRVLLNEVNYKLRKKDMGKNGWYYEKYNGKKYKLYYVNNVVQTDVTKLLKLKKSSSSNTNNFYIEVNRAACTVTIFMKNKDTGKYDLPVKTCTVSVGRDVSTVAGTGGLTLHSSYTPLGTYSICTNGQSVKYTMKPMVEPDGSTVYARWATHIVGNVYFHAIAVGSQSHYALSSSTYNRLGSPASAGCIRMTVADAKWIYDYASTGSTVKIIKGKASKPGPMGKNAVIKTKGVSYDPTDPAVPTSRKKADYKAKRISGYMTKTGTRVGY
jgi:Uncharacterized protein conserved in bacteria